MGEFHRGGLGSCVTHFHWLIKEIQEESTNMTKTEQWAIEVLHSRMFAPDVNF